MNVQKARSAFCYKQEIGYIEKGEFIPVPFNFVTFLRMVIKYLSTSHSPTADMALKNAIIEYCSAQKMHKIYKGSILSDSEFFNYYKNMVNKKAKFQAKFQKNLLLMKNARENQRKESLSKSFTTAKQRPACKSAYLLGIKS